LYVGDATRKVGFACRLSEQPEDVEVGKPRHLAGRSDETPKQHQLLLVGFRLPRGSEKTVTAARRSVAGEEEIAACRKGVPQAVRETGVNGVLRGRFVFMPIRAKYGPEAD
jgi:hypothetical protein